MQNNLLQIDLKRHARIQNKIIADTRLNARISFFYAASAAKTVEIAEHILEFTGQNITERRRTFYGLAGKEETGHRQFINL